MEYLLIIVGIGVGFLIAKLLERRNTANGNIIVSKDEEKTLFSLELNGDPHQIEFKKKVVFNVLVPEDESVRR